MRILLTGADGFVGQHLWTELEQHDYEVRGTDKPEYDLAIPGEATRMIDEAEPDYIVHLAARYGRLLCRDEPHRAVADNTAATTEIAAVCAGLQIPILYASSSEVYGDHGSETIDETSPLHTTTTIYGLSKLWGEDVLDLYLGENCLIVRMNMLYGPGQLAGYGRCSLATFIENAVVGEPYTVHHGTSRSWLYITDAVRALRMLIDSRHTGVFNLGNPAPAIPMTDVARLVEAETGVPPVFANPPPDQIRHKNYDSTKLLRTIDWHPVVPLVQGVRRTVEWAREETAIAA